MAKRKKAKTRGKGGGKLSRSEIVQVRLDPKLRYAAELAAQKHRRTLSSFIEWCVQEGIEKVVIGLSQNETVNHVVAKTWDQREPMRFLFKALHYPHLLSFEEEKLWHTIFSHRIRWARPVNFSPEWTSEELLGWIYNKCNSTVDLTKNLSDLDERRLVNQFPIWKQYTNGEINEKELLSILENGDWETESMYVGGKKYGD